MLCNETKTCCIDPSTLVFVALTSTGKVREKEREYIIYV